MPDMEDLKESKQYHTDIRQKTEGFFLKGANALDWGMKNRLARIFNPQSGRTVMLAIDHGYFQGPTTGLERIDVNILPIVPYADTLMLTRGILRSIVPPATQKSIVLRVSGGTSILKELSNEEIAVDIEESIRLNVCAMAVQVFIGGEYERQSIINMTRMVDIGTRYGIPTLAVTAVGKDMARDARYFRLATRICAELGAHYIKTYYVEKDFETVCASCPVPIVMAGGKKIETADVTVWARRKMVRPTLQLVDLDAAERQYVDAAEAVAQSLAVTREHVMVGEQVMPEQDRLRALEVGELVIKKRGLAIDPEQFRRRLKYGGGRERIVLVLTRLRDKPSALICRPV